MRPFATLAMLVVPLAVSLTLVPSAACSQSAQPVPVASAPSIDGTVQRAVIDSVAVSLEKGYVDADTGRRIAHHLRRRLQDGAYATHTDPVAFAMAVSTDLKAINGDKHLFLMWSGGMPATGPVPIMRSPGGGAPGGGAPIVAPGPVVPPTGNAERLINHGLRKAEILPGNVGYLLIDEFAGGDGFADAIAGALRFLERTDALIIDVRNNRGGHGEMSHLLFSHFLPATPVPTIRVRDRQRGVDEVIRSDSVVPGPRRTDVPLFVLTSRATVSAAEEFAFVLRRLGRATIVGDRTSGAGHMNTLSSVGHGFTVSVSFARVSDPVTGAEWEKVGVQPTLVAAPSAALEVAHAQAMRAIADQRLRSGGDRMPVTRSDGSTHEFKRMR